MSQVRPAAAPRFFELRQRPPFQSLPPCFFSAAASQEPLSDVEFVRSGKSVVNDEGRRRTHLHSAPPGRLNRRDVDLLHRHHCLEGTFRLTATSRKRVSEYARGDLPGEAP